MAGGKAIWSLRLRLHSGLTTLVSKERSPGARFFGRAVRALRGLVFMYGLKPVPFKAWWWGRVEVWWGRGMWGPSAALRMTGVGGGGGAPGCPLMQGCAISGCLLILQLQTYNASRIVVTQIERGI